MDDLFTKYFLGELTPGQKKELFERISGNPDAKAGFARLQNSWALACMESSEDDSRKARVYLDEFRKLQRRKTARRFLVNVSKYAAVLVAGILLAWIMIPENRLPEQSAAVINHLSVPAGQRAILTLSDGTRVWVNAKSTISYPGVFGKDIREVTLTGEAYFDVRSDPEHPFVITSGDFRTIVTGTQFNLFAYDGFFDLSLIEGHLHVRNSDNEIFLDGQERATWKDGRFMKSIPEESARFLWTDGIYSFDDIPFPDIIDKLQLYYDVRIEVQNETLLTRKYTGKFRQRDGIDNVLRIIQKVYPFIYKKDEEKNIIYIN